MAKKKYYVIWEGNKTGVFESWEECKRSTHGVKGAKYKSFKMLKTAQKAFSESYEKYRDKTVFKSTLSDKELKQIGQPNLETVTVDAACSGNPGLMEYQGVEAKTKKLIFRQGPFEGASNNIGEFLALVHALAHMKKTNDKRAIYSDSKIAIAWVRDKTARSNVKQTNKNRKVIELVKRAVNWLKTNDFDNKILKWETKAWGEIPADFGRKK